MTRIWKLALSIALIATFAVAALGIAQAPPTEPVASGGVAADLLAFFTNEGNAVLAAMLFGLIWKFFPAFRNLSNQWIPVLTAFVSFLVHAAEPSTAHASFLGDLLRTTGGFLFPIVRATIDSKLSQFAYEHLLRGPTTEHWGKPELKGGLATGGLTP